MRLICEYICWRTSRLSVGADTLISFWDLFQIIMNISYSLDFLQGDFFNCPPTVVLNGGSGGGYPKSGPKLNFNGSGAS